MKERVRTHPVRPNVDVFDELHNPSERKNKQRILLLSRRNAPNDLEDVLIGRAVVVHAEDGVPSRVGRSGRRPTGVVVLGEEGAVEFCDLEGLEDSLTRHESFGGRLGDLRRLGLRDFFAGGKDWELVSVATTVRGVGVHLLELFLPFFLEEELYEAEWSVREEGNNKEKNDEQAHPSSPRCESTCRANR
jgi:hypothetical protein